MMLKGLFHPHLRSHYRSFDAREATLDKARRRRNTFTDAVADIDAAACNDTQHHRDSNGRDHRNALSLEPLAFASIYHTPPIVDDERRRKFIALAGVATVGLPLGVLDQQSRKLPTIGSLGSVTPSVWRSWVGAFLQ